MFSLSNCHPQFFVAVYNDILDWNVLYWTPSRSESSGLKYACSIEFTIYKPEGLRL